jgi:hypothetical protein
MNEHSPSSDGRSSERPIGFHEKRELAEDASDLLKDKAFQAALLSLRKRWFDQAIAAKSAETKLELLAQLKALEAIPQELGGLVNDYRMAKHNA